MSETQTLAQRVLQRQSEMETERKPWESLWRDCATYIDPNADDFGAETERRQGGKKGEKVFDTTAIQARDRLVAAHESTLTPRNSMWHGLACSDQQVNEIEEVREYLEELRNRTFASRYNPAANFSSQLGAYYNSKVTFGTGGTFIDEQIGVGLRYKTSHLGELFLGEDHQGRVDTVHRQFSLNARQAMQASEKYGWDLPEAIERAARHSPDQKFWFLHCVGPSGEEGYGKANQPWRSIYMAKDFSKVIGQGGYAKFPWAIGRYLTGPRETYGRSPSQTVLRSIQMLNEVTKTIVRIAQRQGDPPMFLGAHDPTKPFSMRAGSFNWGMIGADGKPLVSGYQDTADLKAALEIVQDLRKSINDAFLVTLFQIMVDNPRMTATEAMLRAQEKGVLITPIMGRDQTDYLGPMIEREIDILARAGQFEDLEMPDPLREALANGKGIDITYDAPLNRLQRTDEAVGLIRTIETLLPIAEIDPNVIDVVDPLEMARIVADANGAPAKALRTVDELRAIAEEKRQRADLETAIKAAPALGKTAKDLAQAQATGGSSPQPIPLVQPA